MDFRFLSILGIAFLKQKTFAFLGIIWHILRVDVVSIKWGNQESTSDTTEFSLLLSQYQTQRLSEPALLVGQGCDYGCGL